MIPQNQKTETHVDREPGPSNEEVHLGLARSTARIASSFRRELQPSAWNRGSWVLILVESWQRRACGPTWTPCGIALHAIHAL